MIRLLAWVGMALLAAFVVFSAGGAPGTLSADRRLITILAVAVLLAGWVIAWRRDAKWRPRSVLLPVIAIGLASLAISTAFSRFPRVSVEYLAFAVVLAALYLLLVRLFAEPFFRVRLLALSTIMFFVIAIGYIGAVLVRWIGWWSAIGGFAVPPLRPESESLTFGNPSHVLVVAALLAIPAAAASPWTTRRGILRAAVVVGLTGVVALLTGSRSGWLALAIATAFAVVLGVITVGPRLRELLRSPLVRTTRFRLAIAGAAVAVLVPLVVLMPGILRRVTDGGEDLRLGFLAVALRLFSESPLVGTGLGTWVVQRTAYTIAPEADYYIPHAHNVYLQTLAEQGLVGIIAGIVAIAGLTWLVHEAIRSTGIRRQMGAATASGLVYFAAHQALDFNFNLPSVLVALALPIAYLDATSETSLPVPRRVGLARPATRVAGAGFAVATVLAVTFLTWQELPALDSDRATAMANEGEWAAARDPATAAAAADPSINSFVFTAALTEARAGNHDEAARLFRHVAEQTDFPEAWVNLAAEELAAGNTAAVGPGLTNAMRLGYQRPAVAMAVGDLALRSNDEAMAIRAFTNVAALSPSILADPWWDQDGARASARVVVADLASQQNPAAAWEIALMTGDGGRAAALAPDDTARAFVNAWLGDEPALQALLERCGTGATDARVLFFCARIAARNGDYARANELRAIAFVESSVAAGAGAELRVADEPLVGRSIEGEPAYFWGSFTYRRPTPWDVLVPSLVHLTLE